ncbi:MAG: ankyrin repeat domain-containing protein [Legionella sp.]|uniref:ankyrin repeat domain-containing protein n=1 Tax=Legionella sp. TaxID=459 RepID=UPI00283ECD9A|nr:ankyrin repeat domain-containing protein [Legionella sp.]
MGTIVNNEYSAPEELDSTIQNLIEAVELGNVPLVDDLLKNSAFPEGVEKASSQALGNMDPLLNPDIATDLWWFLDEPHKPEDKRPSQSTLHEAWQRISDCIELLLDAGADPNTTDQDGISVLNNIGMHAELADILARLLQLGADSNARYYNDMSPLHTAASFVGRKRHAQLLLEYGAEPDSVDEQGNTPLMEASGGDSLEIVQILLKAGADINHCNDDGETPLTFAGFSRGPYRIAQELIDAGARVNHRNKKGQTTLMNASRFQSFNLMQILIDAGADTDCRDNKGRTALMHALKVFADIPKLVNDDWYRDYYNKHFPKESSLQVTTLLINSGANYNLADNKGFFTIDYALMAKLNGVELPPELKIDATHLNFCRAAIHNNHSELILLSESEEIPKRISALALNLASVRGNSGCCNVLLEHGADINGSDLRGNQPIESAATGLHLQTVLRLIAHGTTAEGLSRALSATCMADYHRWPEEKTKPLKTRRLEQARWLLEQGANPNDRERLSDNPPLSLAISYLMDYEMTLLLLEYGANPAELDNMGRSPLEQAQSPKMKALLQQWSSKPCQPK